MEHRQKKRMLEDRGAKRTFLGSWLRSDEEGRTAEEEEVTSREREVEEEMDRDSVGSKQACFNFKCSCFLRVCHREVMWLVWFGAGGCVMDVKWRSDGEESDCVLVFVFFFFS